MTGKWFVDVGTWRLTVGWLCSLLLLTSGDVMGQVASESANRADGPLSPEESLRAFQLSDERLRIELVAAEPEVIDPVAMQFDAAGRLWVVEMGDYPFGPAPGQPPKSRIKLLQDNDRDGRFESAQIFADQLLFVTELQPWQDGLIVTMAGEVAFLRDKDGDGRMDERETWYRGFAQENSQLRANHPRLGLDGWIYVSNGLRGGAVANPRQPDQPAVPLAGMDFRFHPRTQAFEAITGVGQFGLTFDDFGNRFICSNRNPLMHVVLEERFIDRNPRYAPPAARHDVGLAGEQSRIYAVSRAWTTSNLHAGQFTAACGVLVYRGAALPPDYYGNGVTCDPTGNLVHREVMRADGATFTYQSDSRMPPREFLASPDEWFRPVNLANGPDGALYVVDMYRAVIEHPDFMPDELKKRPDLLLGVDRGRIYRIVAKDAPPYAPVSLAQEANTELVKRLATPGWVSDTAFRLLYERQDQQPTVIAALEDLARNGSAVAATKSLHLLQCLDVLRDEVLVGALESSNARVREQAVWLADTRAGDGWRERVVARAGDADARVRFAVAMALAPVRNEAEVAALETIARGAVRDIWTQRAVAIASGEHAGPLLVRLLQPRPNQTLTTELAGALRELMGVAAAGRQVAAMSASLSTICEWNAEMAPPALRRSLLVSLVESLGRGGMSLETVLPQASTTAREQFQRILSDSRGVLTGNGDLGDRIAAAQLLVFDPESESQLVQLVRYESSVTHQLPVELRLKILQGLARQPQVGLLRELLADWPRESPAFRRGLVEILLARPDRAHALLTAIEARQVKPNELEATASGRLLKHSQPDIRRQAEMLLASLVPADRQRVLEDYQPVLKMKADPVRGKLVFTKNCSTCHRIGDLGVNVAPDISDSRVKQPEQLLADILQPNRAIDNNYLSYTVVTTDGVTLTGVIASETGTSVTLRQQEGKDAVLLRTNIEELRSNGVSLMPEGLEKNIPPQDMADLIAFIKQWRYLDGRTPLGAGG